MKKVLSVLLAAAMVMGMSVSAFADKEWGKGPEGAVGTVNVEDLRFDEWMYVVYTDNGGRPVYEKEARDEFIFHPGDVAYFELETVEQVCQTEEHIHTDDCYDWSDAHKEAVKHNDGCLLCKELVCKETAATHTHTDDCYDWSDAHKEAVKHNDGCLLCKELVCNETEHKHSEDCKTTAVEMPYTGPVDADWAIYIKDKSSFIKSAEFAVLEKNGKITDNTSTKYVKITFQEAYDELEQTETEFYFYIADTSRATHGANKLISEKASVHYLFDNWVEKYVDFDFINDVEFDAKWVVKPATKGTATFSFNKEAYFVVKMNPEEEVIFNFTSKYDKAVDKLFNYDADLSFYNFKGTKDVFNRNGDLVIPADDDTFVYEIVNGKVAEVEAEYVEDYEVIKGTKVDGWVIKTNELGYYVVSDVEAEIEAEETEDTTKPSTNKTNPETGANDFVGAAVALAVVSVAAAGALAFKK